MAYKRLFYFLSASVWFVKPIGYLYFVTGKMFNQNHRLQRFPVNYSNHRYATIIAQLFRLLSNYYLFYLYILYMLNAYGLFYFFTFDCSMFNLVMTFRLRVLLVNGYFLVVMFYLISTYVHCTKPHSIHSQFSWTRMKCGDGRIETKQC